MAAGKPFQQHQTLRNGRDYILHYHPMADGGWVTLCEDVTERHRMERELRLQFERFDQAVNHMSHGLCHVRPGRAADRVQRAISEDLRARSRDRETRRNVQRELLTHWMTNVDEPGMTADGFYEKRKRGSADGALSTMRLRLKDGRVIEATTRATAGRRLGFGARGRHRAARATRRCCASRTSCSTPRWRTWRTACACSTRTGAWSCATGAIWSFTGSGRTMRCPARRWSS